MATSTRDSATEELSEEEAHAAFEAQTLDATGETRIDFLAALDRGDYDDTEDEQILRLKMLTPFGR